MSNSWDKSYEFCIKKPKVVNTMEEEERGEKGDKNPSEKQNTTEHTCYFNWEGRERERVRASACVRACVRVCVCVCVCVCQ